MMQFSSSMKYGLWDFLHRTSLHQLDRTNHTLFMALHHQWRNICKATFVQTIKEDSTTQRHLPSSFIFLQTFLHLLVPWHSGKACHFSAHKKSRFFWRVTLKFKKIAQFFFHIVLFWNGLESSIFFPLCKRQTSTPSKQTTHEHYAFPNDMGHVTLRYVKLLMTKCFVFT